MSYQKGTFNTIFQSNTELGGNFPVWSRVDKLYQGGGYIDLTAAGYVAGDVIAAGSMVIFNGPGKVVYVADKAYDATATYKVGAVVIQDSKVYVCKTAITAAEAFDSSKWDDKTSSVNGLVMADVCIPDGCINATVAVVRAGRIYADRVPAGILSSVESLLPMIEFVHEA